jgi:vacuolar-type H+-ATPase subunit E/Vma4
MSLEPLREALLAEAEDDVERLRAEAAARSAAQIAQAEQEAAERIRQARREGLAAADVEALAEVARARRTARELVLAARRDTYEDLRRHAHAAVSALRITPEYEALVERLAQHARRRLGPDTHVDLDAGNRRLDYALPSLTDRCLAALAGSVERLWR